MPFCMWSLKKCNCKRLCVNMSCPKIAGFIHRQRSLTITNEAICGLDLSICAKFKCAIKIIISRKLSLVSPTCKLRKMFILIHISPHRKKIRKSSDKGFSATFSLWSILIECPAVVSMHTGTPFALVLLLHLDETSHHAVRWMLIAPRLSWNKSKFECRKLRLCRVWPM